MSTLGAWLKTQGFTVDDNNVPVGRSSTWRGVEWLVVHHTGSDCDGAEADIAAYCRVGGKGTFPPLCQIMLGHSGKVWMTCRQRPGQAEPGRASHAGLGRGFGVAANTLNERALGIETQCVGSHKLATHKVQYAALIRLLAALCRRYGVPTSKIIGHKDWSSTGKVDPRDDMKKIRADVAAELTRQKSAIVKATEMVTASKPGPVLTHSGVIGSSSPYHKTPLEAPVSVVAGKPFTAASIILPEGRYICTLQVRMPTDLDNVGEVELVRVRGANSYPKQTSAEDSTGHGVALPARKIGDKWYRWRTPIEHPIDGGGRVDFRIVLTESSDNMRFVVKATRVA
jgi:hypothetical protein